MAMAARRRSEVELSLLAAISTRVSRASAAAKEWATSSRRTQKRRMSWSLD
jgi:hypothetical protein